MDDDVEKRLSEIESRAGAATAGPWYAHATDDSVFMNARYVGLEPSVFRHDGQRGMDSDGDEQADSKRVIAVTLLQAPRLADIDEFDGNTVFIAHSREDVPWLVQQLRSALQAKGE